MLEYSAFTAPEVMTAYNATPASGARMSIWRRQLRELERTEKASKKAAKPSEPRGPGRLQPHVPWI